MREVVHGQGDRHGRDVLGYASAHLAENLGAGGIRLDGAARAELTRPFPRLSGSGSG